jgi:hypothetical protein
MPHLALGRFGAVVDLAISPGSIPDSLCAILLL